MIRQVLPVCVVCAQYGTVFVNKHKREKGGEGKGSNRRRRGESKLL